MMVTIAMIFTCLPWIHRKINQPEQHNFDELSGRALAIMANITGHTGLNMNYNITNSIVNYV